MQAGQYDFGGVEVGLLSMKKHLTVLTAALIVLLAASSTTQAQLPASPPAAYEGPRFPGGPDSLLAWLRRHPILKADKGPVFVQFDVMPGAPLKNLQTLTPFGRKPLKPVATAEALATARAMPAWTPGRQDVETPVTTVTLGLNPTSDAVPAYAYADELPVFPGIEPGIVGLYRYLPTVLVLPEVSAEVLRKNPSNDVYAYFEVSETGRIENRQIISGNLPALNKAALLTLDKLPNATTPARLQGRAVRIYYVLSIGFNLD